MKRLLALTLLWVLGCVTPPQQNNNNNNNNNQQNNNPPEATCGEPPELPYVCPGGKLPCECLAKADGSAAWKCGECAKIDCNTTPNDPTCSKDKACVNCHGLANGPNAQGIENAHPWSYLGCVECHGGKGVDPADPNKVLKKEEAHVSMPKEMLQSGTTNTPSRTTYASYYLARAGVENFTGGKEWLRFMNPGDLRVVDNTCSKSGCHAGASTKVKNSVMSTVVGKLDAMLYATGVPRAPDLAAKLGYTSTGKRLATFGALHADDPTWNAATAPPGSVPHIHALTTVNRETEKPFGTFTEDDIYKETINKLCGTCHLGHNGKNDSFGTFRSAGCTACHMAYDWSGKSESGDPMINKSEPTYPEAYTQIRYPERPHPKRHTLTRSINAKECLACHTGSARSVFQFMGIRTDDNHDLTRAKANGANITFTFSNLIDNRLNPQAKLHGLTQDQLIETEDLNGDGQDDTPADVHFRAGMECVDCHTATDMHGDGRIYSRQNQAVKVRCSFCHGSLEYAADPDAKDNLINEIYHATGKASRKNLFKFDKVPQYGELGYPAVKAAGMWLKLRTTQEWRWVPQIRWGAQWDATAKDCFGDGKRVDPRNGTFVCTPAASIAHGRWQGLNAAAGDFDDGVGPRPAVDVIKGADGASATVRFGFSHLGEPTTKANQEHAGGVECTACHATWHNVRYGTHLGLKDMNGTTRLYDWDRITGKVTLGTQAHFDFSYVSMLDQQLGVSPKGKIAWFLPARLKTFVRQQVLDPSTNTQIEFMKRVGDANFAWKTYRDRVGFGNLIQGAGTVQNAPGYAQVCLEPQGFCDQDTNKNKNGGLGVDTSHPHASQRRAFSCSHCHLDDAGNGAAQIGALYGWSATGRTPATSAYLNKIKNIQTAHGSYDTANGFVLADDGIQHRVDWMVDENTGYPLVYTLHVRTDDGKDGRPAKGISTWDREAAGPITKQDIDKLKRIRVKDGAN